MSKSIGIIVARCRRCHKVDAAIRDDQPNKEIERVLAGQPEEHRLYGTTPSRDWCTCIRGRSDG